MLKIKIVKSHSGIFRAILEELKRHDQSAIADLLSAGMISFAPPELIRKRDGRSFAVYGERERVILSACYQTLSQVANKKLSGKGNVKKLYSKLDEVVRASIRRYLKLSGKGELINTMYSSPLKFPSNLAFSKEILSSGGFVSLVQIKEKFEGKDQKCELKTTGEMGGKNFIQNCRRVNAEKIQISVGDKVIIMSTDGNVGPIRKSSISNGVNIGTTNPSQKLDVGSGNVSANDYWIGTAGKWASQLGDGAEADVLVYSCPDRPGQGDMDCGTCKGQIQLGTTCQTCFVNQNGECYGCSAKPCVLAGRLVKLPPFAVFLNSTTGLTCNNICANKGFASCKSIGLDANASDGSYKFGFGTSCATFWNSDCNNVMFNRNTVCSGHTVDWTNCLCQ